MPCPKKRAADKIASGERSRAPLRGLSPWFLLLSAVVSRRGRPEDSRSKRNGVVCREAPVPSRRPLFRRLGKRRYPDPLFQFLTQPIPSGTRAFIALLDQRLVKIENLYA